MSKKVFLIRHATAEEGSHSSMFKDVDRELTPRGMMEAAKMGAYLKHNNVDVNKIIHSNAARTTRTAEVISEQLQLPEGDIVRDEGLYGGGPRAYLRILNELDESISSLAIVGHNPDISFFAEYLTRDDVGGSFEKCTVVCLEINNNVPWSELSSKSMDFKWRKSVKELNE